MLTCEFCGAENNDLAAHCSACNEPLTPEAARADVKQTEVQHHKALVKKEILYGTLGVLLVAGLAFAAVRAYKHNQLKDTVKTFYTAYAQEEESHMPNFWKCMCRSDKLPKDNIELSSMLDAAIVKSNGNYAKHVLTKCMPIISKTAPALEGLEVPTFLSTEFSAYVGATKQLQKDTEAYIGTINALEQEIARDKVVSTVAGNFHAAEKEGEETWAYDHFLRCAVPSYGAAKDSQPILEHLASTMKDPVGEVGRWRKDCYPAIEKTTGAKEDPDFKNKVTAVRADDRDVTAFSDVLKAATDKQRRELNQPFEKAWFTFGQAHDALMQKFGEYLND